MAALLVAATSAAAQPLPWPPTLADLDRFGRSVAASRCARPLEQKSSFLPTPGRPDAADEMRSVDCRSWRVATYVSRSGGTPREQPMELVFVAADAQLDARLGVGADEAAVLAALGPPAARPAGNLRYDLTPRDTLSFELWQGRVRAVSWSWHVD